MSLRRLDDPAVALAHVAQAAVELVKAGVAEEVELDEAGVGDGVLVPLADEAPGIAVASIGTCSSMRLVEMMMPPECWLRCRGRPSSSCTS